MWARVVETMLAVWLALTPFIFDSPFDDTSIWAVSFVSSFVVMVLSLGSLWTRLRRAHLALLPVGIALALYGRLAGGQSPTGAQQSFIMVGLLVAMHSIIPRRAAEPPVPWREERGEGQA